MTDAPTPMDVIADMVFRFKNPWLVTGLNTEPESVKDIYRHDADAIRSALSAAGYVVRPREPTKAMVDAAIERCDDMDQADGLLFYGAIYRAMIAGGEEVTIPQELVDIAARAHDVASSDFSEPPPDPMRAALEAYEAALWRPIETAPMDGTNVLLWADGPVVGFWARGGWELTCPGSYVEDSDVDPRPTHWRPAPAGPQMATATALR